MNRPLVWSLDELRGSELGRAAVWSTGSVRERAASLPWPLLEPLEPLPAGLESLVVVGGGRLIDEAKAFRARSAPQVRLVAVPSRWGSGAEASPVTVLDRAGRKEIHVDAGWLPDARVIWPELAATLPPEAARAGCADALTHALEGFLSPLAGDSLRREIAPLLSAMFETGPEDARWFDLSARACAAQARSSVGLVHGIAHVLEGPLRDAGTALGHAALCAAFLWPVVQLNRASSTKLDELLALHGVDGAALDRLARELWRPLDYERALPSLVARWRDVLRDPCTRTNSVLVRPSTLDFFRALPCGERS